MALDKSALESLKLDHSDESRRYREAGSHRTRRWVLIGIALAVVAAFAYRLTTSAAEVSTATVELPAGASDGAVLNATGYVVARRLATVSSKVTGRIDTVEFEEGASVTDGQVLARLDAQTARAEYELAKRSLESARSELHEIEVRLAEARRQLGRDRALAERKLIADSVVDTADAEVGALAARLDAARSQVSVAEARLRLSQQGLDDLVIRAPFAGVIISKDAQPGEMVSPISAGGGFTRTGIATIVDMDSREIEVDVNEAYINRVQAGQKVVATLDAYPDWKLPGHVIGIVPTADRQKATVRVRIAFDKLDPRILTDMGIKVGFKGGGAAAGAALKPRIPENALQRDGDAAFVWVVRDGHVERRAIKVESAVEGMLPVAEGLAGGEVIVVDAPKRLRDGAPVELKAAG